MTEGVFAITDNDKSKLAPIPAAGYIEQPNQVIIINNGERSTVTDDKKKQKKKKAGVFGFFKAAMFVLRHRSKGKQRTAEVAGAVSDWKKLVGSMRPLHLQENIQQSPRPIESLTLQTNCPSSPSSCNGTMSQYASANDLQALDVPSDHMHSAGTMSQYASANDLQALAASTSSDHMSQYASANNLQELDEEEDPDQVFDAIGGDDMIDVKAEEFILQFYQQMRRQNIDSMSGQFN